MLPQDKPGKVNTSASGPQWQGGGVNSIGGGLYLIGVGMGLDWDGSYYFTWIV